MKDQRLITQLCKEKTIDYLKQIKNLNFDKDLFIDLIFSINCDYLKCN